MKFSKQAFLFVMVAIANADATNHVRKQTRKKTYKHQGVSMVRAESDRRILVPVNDICTDALTLSPGTTLTGSTEFANPADVDDCGVSYTDANAVWFKVTGTGRVFTVDTFDSEYDTKLFLYSGSCSNLVCEVGNDDAGGTLQSQIIFGSEAGVDYYFLLHGWSLSNGSYQISLTERDPVDNDYACDATPITLQTPTAFNNALAGYQPGEVSPGGGESGFSSCRSQDGWCSFETGVQNSVWFEFVPDANGCVDIYTDNRSDLQLALWEIENCEDFSTFHEVAANDDSGLLGFALAPRIAYAKIYEGSRYLIQLDGYHGSTSAGNIIIGQSVDTTLPVAYCYDGVNPGGNAAETGEGFYKILGTDDCSDPEMYVVDTVSGVRFGPYESGTFIKYIKAPGVTPSSRQMMRDVQYMIKGNGDPEVVAIDGAGNEGTTECPPIL